MTLPRKAIQEFKELHKQEFGIELSNEQAVIQANQFYDMMKLIVKPNLTINIKK